MYKRPDGLYEKQIMINGNRYVFRGYSEREVMKKIAEWQYEQKNGRLFKVIAEEWDEEHRNTVEYSTTKSYISSLNRAIEHFGDTRISEIKPKDIQNYISNFAKKGYAKKTVIKQLSIINMIFTKAVIDDEIETNPAQYVQIPKGLKKQPREMPTAEEIQIVKDSINCTFGLAAYTILYTGCRKGELAALQGADIVRDTDNKIIKISKSITWQHNKPYIKQPKSYAVNREIILLDRLDAVLPHVSPQEYLFSIVPTEPLTDKQFRRQWELYQRETGLTITPHQLRHAYATILFEAGIDVKDAQELLGHSQISVTRDIYTHISKNRKKHTAKLLNEFDG